MLYMIIAGALPFQESNDSETLIKILEVVYEVPDFVSEECADLLSKVLVRCVLRSRVVPWFVPRMHVFGTWRPCTAAVICFVDDSLQASCTSLCSAPQRGNVARAPCCSVF